MDGQVYAMAQGAVVTGGFVAGRAGNSQTLNHPTVGRVLSEAIVERAAPDPQLARDLKLQLHRPDFTTASRVAFAINKRFGGNGAVVAQTSNASLIRYPLPELFAGRTADFIAEMEAVTVDAIGLLRSLSMSGQGTVTLGRDVVIAPVAIMHGGLSVEIQTTLDVSQPAPLSQGTTTTVPKLGIGVR